MTDELTNPRIQEYEDALKRGRKAYNKAVSEGRSPYLPSLDSILEHVNVKQEVRLGMVKIPLDRIVGTKTEGRQSGFADNFMPLMDRDSEFGCKWRSVVNYHLDQGIGDPIVAYEYLNKFYVLEGNKRVSVLKYFGGDSIDGNVIRVLPYPDDTNEAEKKFLEDNGIEVTTIKGVGFNRDKDGNSTWPQKNSEKDIDDFLSKLSTRAAQHECFNNPISEGDVFREMVWGKLPPLNRFREIVIYADPSYSNSRRKESSTKAVVAMGMLAGTYYLISCRLNHATNDEFAEWIYEIHQELARKSPGTQLVTFIECNALQDPFHEQVYLPLFAAKGKKYGWYPSVRKDTRKKPEKFERIEGNLEPLARNGKLVFNEAERDNPHMQRMEEQFLLVSPSMKSPADGPDAVEGGVFILRQRAATMAAGALTVGLRPNNKRRV